MAVLLNPYLSFDGIAEEVLNFYKSIFGGEVTLSRFGDTPGMPVTAEQKDLIMHGDLVSPHVRLMVSDAMTEEAAKSGGNISLSLSGDDDATLSAFFSDLSEGGTVREPLVTAPWGDKFGMVTDRYGVNWMFNIGTSTLPA